MSPSGVPLLAPNLPRVARHALVATCVVVLVAMLGFSPVSAGEAPTEPDQDRWGIMPVQTEGFAPRPFFFIEVLPGLPVADVAVLVNRTSEPLDFMLYAADGYNDETGAFVLRSDDEPMQGVGAWIELPFDEVRVDPGTRVRVPFTITPPQDVTPGDHSGGIVAINLATAQVGDGDVGLDIRSGVGARVHTRVPGPAAPGVSVTGVDFDLDTNVGTLFGLPSSGRVTFTFENTGNLMLEGTAEVKVSGLFFTASAPPVEIVDLLPGNRGTLTVEVDGILPTGRPTATVTVTALGESDSASSSATAVPWLLLVILLALVLGTLILRRRRRERGTRAGKKPGAAGEGGPAKQAATGKRTAPAEV